MNYVAMLQRHFLIMRDINITFKIKFHVLLIPTRIFDVTFRSGDDNSTITSVLL